MLTTAPHSRTQMSLDGDTLTIGRRVFPIDRARAIPVLISQGRAPIAAQLIAHGAPPQFASAVSLVGWRDAWDVVTREVFEAAVRWRMGRDR